MKWNTMYKSTRYLSYYIYCVQGFSTKEGENIKNVCHIALHLHWTQKSQVGLANFYCSICHTCSISLRKLLLIFISFSFLCKKEAFCISRAKLFRHLAISNEPFVWANWKKEYVSKTISKKFSTYGTKWVVDKGRQV